MAQNIKIYILLSVLFSNLAYGSHVEYEHMLQTYEQLEQKNFAVWYNIGVLYKEMGQEAQAICAFLRAQKQANFFEFYKAAQPVFQMGQAIKVYGSKFYFYVYSMPLYFYHYVFLVFLFLFLWLWYRMMRYGIKKRYAYIIFCCMTIIYILYGIKYDWMYNSYAVIIDQHINCFAGPDTSFMVTGSVKTPEVYKIYKKQNEFLQIKNNGNLCWICNKNVEEV